MPSDLGRLLIDGESIARFPTAAVRIERGVQPRALTNSWTAIRASGINARALGAEPEHGQSAFDGRLRAMGASSWASVCVSLALAFSLSGCRKKTVTIEPYSLIPGAAPEGTVIVTAHYEDPGVPWRVGQSAVFDWPDREREVKPRVTGALLGEERSYTHELYDLSKPFKVAFIPLAPPDRPLPDTGLLVLARPRSTPLVLRAGGEVKHVRVVEQKFVKHDGATIRDPHFLSYPGLSEAVTNWISERVLDPVAQRPPAVLYWIRSDEEDPERAPTGELDYHDWNELAAYVLALVEARRADGTPVLDLTVQRAGKARGAIQDLEADYENRTKARTNPDPKAKPP